ncbi:GGDEF domain-containing protein [Sphingomonas sanguinis]|uniref:GGDEF domain-containing protein n=1 Tax=Sphingomonas sanguinis TaxID=33051 RepID=UPI001C5877C4|nr:GGDEF domain-containing protein [Sphingomonas sanguinis]QXT34725.1 GGDEF domain-containing protein [Sphingomonas sanguinis]
MILDIASLQVVAALGSILSGLLHFFPGLASRGSGRWPHWWGTGKIIIGMTNAAGLCFDGTRLMPLERITDVLLLIGLCLCIHAMSIFARRRPPTAILVLLAVMVSLTVPFVLFGDRDARLSVMIMGGTRTLFNFTAAWMLIHIARTENIRTAWVMGLLFAASVPLFLTRTALLVVAWGDPVWESTAQVTADWSVGIAIILVSLSHLALLLIDAERVQRALSEQASRDCLTGALNRFGLKGIEAGLHGPVTLLLIDIDRFKALNDTQGHGAGDTVLRLLADLAQREIGARGTVARIGGDEFLCVLPDCDEVAAHAIAAVLADRFDRAVGALVDGPCYPALSIGLARGPVAGSLNALIAQADGAMYAVKRQRQAHARTVRAA